MKPVLVIDDNNYNRSNIAEIFELAGYTFLSAESGQSGAELAILYCPDLIICDIAMPVLDGHGVLQRVRQTEEISNISFIFLTAKTEKADVKKRDGAGILSLYCQAF